MREQPDIHARLMSKYEQVPEWWYGVIFGALVSYDGSSSTSGSWDDLTVTMVVFGIVLIEVWHTEFPVWAFCLSLAICAFFGSDRSGWVLMVSFYSLLLCYTHRNDSGYYQPTGRSQVSVLRSFVVAVFSRFVV